MIINILKQSLHIAFPLLIILGIASKIIVHKYAKAGKYSVGDTGYFWREAAKGSNIYALVVVLGDVVGLVTLCLVVCYFAIRLSNN